MPNTYPKTLLVAQSKYQHILDNFANSLWPTIEGKNVDVMIIHTDLRLPQWMISHNVPYWGSKALNECLAPNQRKYDVFGMINDDYLFRPEWFDDVLEKMKVHPFVSPGYVESGLPNRLDEAYEKTKEENAVIAGTFAPAVFFPALLMRKIGLLDENAQEWEDIDWFWRAKLNGVLGVTSTKITTLHFAGLSLRKQSKEDCRIHYERGLRGKENFIKKHGYESYRFLKNIYAGHSYFKQFK